MITIHQINRAGFYESVVLQYQSTNKVKKMIVDLQNGAVMPNIRVYQPINGLYTISDGIHRLCAYLYLGILSFEVDIVPYRREIEGIGMGDTVRVWNGIYSDLITNVIDLGATDRIKISIPVYKSLPNSRNAAWLHPRNVIKL